MRFRKLGLALLACMAMTAIAANAAQANWFVNGAELGATSQKAVTVSNEGSFTLESTVLGAPIVLNASGLECGGSGCSIDGSSFGTNHSTGTLNFTGVTVATPAGCSVAGGHLETEALEDEVVMASGGTETFDKFFPASEGTVFVVVHLEGAECALAGVEAPVKGYVLGETAATGASASTQSVTFNTLSNSHSALKLGKAAATLTGVAQNSLTGGGSFYATE